MECIQKQASVGQAHDVVCVSLRRHADRGEFTLGDEARRLLRTVILGT